jgi:uncharacterized protein YprB with RNaseH-like and TPR domain
MDESLYDRLRKLGVQFTARDLKPPEEVTPESYPIGQVLSGYTHSNSFGDTYVYREDYPQDYLHGVVPFDRHVDLGLLSEWARVSAMTNADLDKVLFLDTETSGLAGGTGTFAFMVGLGYFHGLEFTLEQLFLNSPGEEAAFLAALEEIASPFDTVVTYNGKSFDIPLLNNRYTLNSFRSPFRSFQHIDLLALTRRIWRNRLNDRSLGNIEREILQVERNQEEIPGWMIPDMYYEFLKSRDARPMAGVFYHNKIDILSLAALLLYTARMLSEPLEFSADQTLDLISIARIFEDLGRIEEAAVFYENSLDRGLPRPFFIQTLFRYADLSRKERNWPSAIELWQKAADYGEYEAAVAIAKYFEHQAGDVRQALEWTLKAMQLLEEMRYPLYIRNQKQLEILHRQERLVGKIKRSETYSGGTHDG